MFWGENKKNGQGQFFHPFPSDLLNSANKTPIKILGLGEKSSTSGVK